MSNSSKYKIGLEIYKQIDHFLYTNALIEKIIHFQHKILPIPLNVFDFIFRTKTGRLLFNFYGRNVFGYSYLSRNKDNDKYWLSRDSLYWHFWRQSDLNNKQLKEILSIVSLQSTKVVEIGFGLGRNYRLLHNGVNSYTAVEPNKYLCDYAAKKFSGDKNFKIINQPIEKFLRNNHKFDVLVATNGVFMYVSKKIVDEFFLALPSAGVGITIFLNEGSANGDVFRDDNTVMYDFKSRLIKAGYDNKRFLQKVRDNGIYDYLVMY